MFRGKSVLLIGLGVLGTEMLRELETSGADVRSILDDRYEDLPDSGRHRGPISDLPEVLDSARWDIIVVAAALISASTLNWITKHARRSKVPIYVLPERSSFDPSEVDHPDLSQLIRRPGITDLFARTSLRVDSQEIVDSVAGRRVLITGAGGSIGSEVTRQVLRHGADVVGLLDRDDCLLHDLAVELTGQMHDPRIPLLHADVQHAQQVDRVVQTFGPDVVIHTAALKHVTTLETDPTNALLVNVRGTANVLRAARAADVSKFVNVSTDKAASRVGVLGISKYIGERLTQGVEMASYRSVRFGNVIGSRGSVLHTFRIQALHHEHVLVRGRETSRFFMTAGEAASLVLSTLGQHQPGGTYVFDMGEPVQILQLANAIVDDLVSSATIQLEELRTGEAEHERLFHEHEQPVPTAVAGVQRVEPAPLTLAEFDGILPWNEDLSGLIPTRAHALLEDLLHHPSTT
jgi:FlaA1/EpsC-like NDP-sugar epimerase